MATETALLEGIREVRERLNALETLALEQAQEAGRTFSTAEVARCVGCTPEALSRWARVSGVGAERDGFRLVGRISKLWRWAPVEEEEVSQ